MKFSLSRKFRVLCAFLISAPLFFSSVAAPAYASNTPQLDVASIIALANADRAANGAPALTEDTLLDRAAQLKADDMAAKGYFAHVSPNGTTPWDWFKAVNYYYYDAGENLAQGYWDQQGLNTAWMNSPTHRANILNSVYKKVGIGIAIGSYEGHTTVFVAEEFANPYVTQSVEKAPAATAVAKAPAATTVAKTLTSKPAAVSAVAKKRVTVAPKKKITVKKVPIKRAPIAAVLPKRSAVTQLAVSK